MLLELIKGKYETISIVGMAKNTGKTVTLNHLIGEAMEEDIPIGITSIGRDGENVDLVTETEKPKIYVENGTIVATATELLPHGDAKVELLKVTDFRTPLGNIVIGRIKDRGYIQIAGPQRVNEAKKVSKYMLDLGAEFVLIDGALDRMSSAAPSVSEGTILSTGAALSRDMNKVIEETLHAVNLFNLPEVEDENIKPIIGGIMESGRVSTIDNSGRVKHLEVKTALSCGDIIGDNIDENTKYVVLPGSLVKNTVEDIINSTRSYKNVTIVVKDGTKIFIEPRDWLKYMKYGVNIKSCNRINLVAVTANPYAPQGYFFSPGEFLEKLRSYIKDIPVLDVVYGGE